MKNEDNKTVKQIDEVLENLDNQLQQEENQPIEKITPIKEWLVTYVGEKYKPENMEVNVNMIVKAMAEEFPEFLSVIAEHNFFLGYNTALEDMKERIENKKAKNVKAIAKEIAESCGCECKTPCGECKTKEKK